MKTIELKIWGIVQGVGFRPFLSKMARRNKLKGWVINEGGYVLAKLTGTAAELDSFLRDLKERKPEPAEIVHMESKEVELENFTAFHIKESSQGNDGVVMLPADLSICPSCLKEMNREEDKRYRHPFISCMECGPRYSIIDRVPYDRHNTAMMDFPMCEFCHGQYKDPEDRRYHAQTISCHECGPYLIYRERLGSEKRIVEAQAENPVLDETGSELMKEKALEKGIKALKEGKIIAIKGIGGFHLACRPDLSETVALLRELKGREEKPFAVMFKDLEELNRYCTVSEIEKASLIGKEKPILLLEVKSEAMDHFSHEVSRSSRLLGAFLPYTGLQRLILEETGPLIMTSANLSDEPIIIEENQLFLLKDERLSGVLYNERKIRTGEDDSVARVVGGKLRVGRRARGYVPIPVFMDSIASQQEKVTEGFRILSTGGELKNTFCLSKGPFGYLSQHLGDLNGFAIHEIYENNINRMKNMLRIEPEMVVCDMHPGYFASSFGKKYGEDKGIPVLEVQHHHAHIASVIAEQALKGPVMGIALDGTGYGTDGKIWGGEYLLCNENEFNRYGHLEYVKIVGGDSSAKEGWKAGFSYLYKYNMLNEAKEKVDFLGTESELKLLEKALEMGINVVESSSMGRLFDVVSFILGLCGKSLYEGDAAIRLENEAYKHSLKEPKKEYFGYEIKKPCGSYEISLEKLLKEILEKLENESTELLAWKFHCTVARISVEMAKLCREETGVNQIALSGGVFQNKLLFELLEKELISEGFRVYSNEKVPVNDGGISLGQTYLGALNAISSKVKK